MKWIDKTWEYDSAVWECSNCGFALQLIDGTPKENNYHFCPVCGEKVDDDFHLYDKYTVINNKYLKQIPFCDQVSFARLVEKIPQPDYTYYVVNADEPYADKVLDLIKQGEADD